jgi:drug/metabolite transporter (DMT)-like permease
MRFSNFTSNNNPALFGISLAILGVLILTPDTLVMRLSGLERWPMMGWRGILMGTTLFFIWRLFPSQNRRQELCSLGSWQGILVVIAFGLNSITFTLGIAETSVIVVLTAVALMPLIAAMLSFFMLGEKQGWLGWLTIMLAMLGVFIVVMDGGNALGQPQGSVWLGAVYGLVTAFGLALTFTVTRKYPALSILPACALGSLLSGIVGFALSADGTIFTAPGLDDCGNGDAYPATILYLSWHCSALYEFSHCQPCDVAGNGDWAILGLAWYWRASLSDNDCRQSFCALCSDFSCGPHQPHGTIIATLGHRFDLSTRAHSPLWLWQTRCPL